MQPIDVAKTQDSNSYLLRSRVDNYVVNGAMGCKRVKDDIMTVIKDKAIRVKDRELYATTEVSPERKSSVMAAARAYRWAEMFDLRNEVRAQYNPVKLFYVGRQDAPALRPTLLLTWAQERGFIQNEGKINEIVRDYSRERGAEGLDES